MIVRKFCCFSLSRALSACFGLCIGAIVQRDASVGAENPFCCFFDGGRCEFAVFVDFGVYQVRIAEHCVVCQVKCTLGARDKVEQPVGLQFVDTLFKFGAAHIDVGQTIKFLTYYILALFERHTRKQSTVDNQRARVDTSYDARVDGAESTPFAGYIAVKTA